jgi:hypothetical protein
MRNSYIQGWEFWVDCNAKLELSDSSISRFILDYHDTSVTMMNVMSRIVNASYKSITINNSYINLWDISFNNNADGAISNSKIGIIRVSNGGKLLIQNTTVFEQILGTGEGQITFNHTTLSGGFFLAYAHLTLYGDGSLTPSEVRWYSSTVVRDYRIITTNSYGLPIANAALTLKSEERSTIWNGTTDGLGQANLNITFTDNNYTDTPRLEAVDGNLSATTDVSLFSNTPVAITLGLHDLSVINITSAKTFVGQGFPLPTSVTVTNQGDYAETSVSISLYANTTGIGTQTVYYLMNGTNATIIIDGTATSGLAYGNYTLSAYAWPVTDEMNTANNNCTYGQIRITIPGDVDGDFSVKLADLVMLAKAYSSKLGDTNWNPNADIDGNNIVGLSDLVALAEHYGQHYP